MSKFTQERNYKHCDGLAVCTGCDEWSMKSVYGYWKKPLSAVNIEVAVSCLSHAFLLLSSLRIVSTGTLPLNLD